MLRKLPALRRIAGATPVQGPTLACSAKCPLWPQASTKSYGSGRELGQCLCRSGVSTFPRRFRFPFVKKLIALDHTAGIASIP